MNCTKVASSSSRSIIINVLININKLFSCYLVPNCKSKIPVYWFVCASLNACVCCDYTCLELMTSIFLDFEILQKDFWKVSILFLFQSLVYDWVGKWWNKQYRNNEQPMMRYTKFSCSFYCIECNKHFKKNQNITILFSHTKQKQYKYWQPSMLKFFHKSSSLVQSNVQLSSLPHTRL